MSQQSTEGRLAVVDIPSNLVPYAFIPGGKGPLEMLTREAHGRLLATGGDSGEEAADALQVTRFELRDAMSEFGGLDVEIMVSAGASINQGAAGGSGRAADPVVEALLGQPVMFAWACGTEDDRVYRYHHGIVSAISEIGGDVGATSYRATVMPRAWRLTLKSNCRIFQEDTTKTKNTVDIIKKVLEDHDLQEGVDAVFDGLTGEYEPRKYCVQYRESDFDFISRLMEEDGIAYYFDHTEDRDVMTFVDSKTSHEACAPYDALLVQQPLDAAQSGSSDGQIHDEVISRFTFHHGVRPGRVRLRDYDFENSERKPSGTATGLCEDEPEIYDYPGCFRDDDHGKRIAGVRQEELDVQAQVAHGESDVRSLSAGRTFEIVDHPRDSYRQVYLCTAVTHMGSDESVVDDEGRPVGMGGTTYDNVFECVPSSVQFRPPRIRPKPVVTGVQTARVVGPEDEEIYPEKYLQVKVKFHWDLDDEEHEKASCWVRVVQPWAASGFGAYVIPRVGTEVLVEFEEGDPDRPIINGVLYNDQHVPSVDLPSQKTQTGIKSNSSPGGGGCNEIRFEDKKDEEQVFVQAEKNLDTRVKNDCFEWIGSNRHLIVKTDQYEHVENNRHEKVDADQFEQIGKDRHLKVTGKEAKEVGGSHSFTVTGDVIEVFKSNHSEQTTQNYYVKAMGVVIEATQGITLKVGGSCIVIDPAGVTLKGNVVTVDGAMTKINSGPGSPPMAGQAGRAVSPATATAAEEADIAEPGQMAAIKRQQIESKSGKYGAGKTKPFKPDESEEKSWIEIELVDEQENPVPGERYRITLPDGETVAEGTLDENGLARVDGIDPGECKITFPELDKEAWESA